MRSYELKTEVSTIQVKLVVLNFTFNNCLNHSCKTFYTEGPETENLALIDQATKPLHGFAKLAETASLFKLVGVD